MKFAMIVWNFDHMKYLMYELQVHLFSALNNQLIAHNFRWWAQNYTSKFI